VPPAPEAMQIRRWTRPHARAAAALRAAPPADLPRRRVPALARDPRMGAGPARAPSHRRIFVAFEGVAWTMVWKSTWQLEFARTRGKYVASHTQEQQDWIVLLIFNTSSRRRGVRLGAPLRLPRDAQRAGPPRRLDRGRHHHPAALNTRAVGVFDSGIGGLTVVRALAAPPPARAPGLLRRTRRGCRTATSRRTRCGATPARSATGSRARREDGGGGLQHRERPRPEERSGRPPSRSRGWWGPARGPPSPRPDRAASA